MTKEQMRIVVAEIMGAKWYTGTNRVARWIIDSGCEPLDHWILTTDMSIPLSGESGIKLLPNYPEDLNACAEFRKTLTRRQQGQYTTILKELVQDTTVDTTWDIVDASAYLHTKTFIRLHGRWGE